MPVGQNVTKGAPRADKGAQAWAAPAKHERANCALQAATASSNSGSCPGMRGDVSAEVSCMTGAIAALVSCE